MYTQVCKKCNESYNYENAEELKQWFYFKNGYIRKVCKKCELAFRKQQYDAGRYRYTANKNVGYDKSIAIGSLGSSEQG